MKIFIIIFLQFWTFSAFATDFRPQVNSILENDPFADFSAMFHNREYVECIPPFLGALTCAFSWKKLATQHSRAVFGCEADFHRGSCSGSVLVCAPDNYVACGMVLSYHSVSGGTSRVRGRNGNCFEIGYAALASNNPIDRKAGWVWANFEMRAYKKNANISQAEINQFCISRGP